MSAAKFDPTSRAAAAGSHFATTRWSVVIAAGQHDGRQTQEALETLCCTYWYPLYAFVRRKGYSRDDAADLRSSYGAWHNLRGKLVKVEDLSVAMLDGTRVQHWGRLSACFSSSTTKSVPRTVLSNYDDSETDVEDALPSWVGQSETAAAAVRAIEERTSANRPQGADSCFGPLYFRCKTRYWACG